MITPTSPWFVTTQWLSEHLDDPKLRLIDASWYLPASGRNAQDEFLSGHIPGSVFFDLDKIADTTTGLPHMLPSSEDFAVMVGKLGIASDDTVVIYDEAGLFSAPRVWWTFQVMGAPNVRILEGGGSKWRSEGRPLEAGMKTPMPATFAVRFDPDHVADLEEVAAASWGSGAVIVDARATARFRGEIPEPRPGLRSGHIPNSLNVPVEKVIEDGRMKSRDELRAVFDAAGIDLENPIITSCGSGVTASILALALDIAGARQVAVYDGSWAEWGGRPDTQVDVD